MAKAQHSLRMAHLMKMEPLARTPRGPEPSQQLVFVVTHLLHLITMQARVRTTTTKLKLNLNPLVDMVKHSNDLVLTALRRHRQTQLAASASSSRLLSNLVVLRLLPQADLHLVMARIKSQESPPLEPALPKLQIQL